MKREYHKAEATRAQELMCVVDYDGYSILSDVEILAIIKAENPGTPYGVSNIRSLRFRLKDRYNIVTKARRYAPRPQLNFVKDVQEKREALLKGFEDLQTEEQND